MSRSRLAGSLLGVGLALGVAMTPPVAAAWSLSPSVISGPDPVFLFCGEGGCLYPDVADAHPQVLMDAHGDTTVVYQLWTRQKQRDPGRYGERGTVSTVNVLVKTRPAGGRWSRPVTLARRVTGGFPTYSAAKAVGDARGDVAVVWPVTRKHGTRGILKMVARPAGGKFAKPRTLQTLYTPDAGFDVAMGASGDLAVGSDTHDLSTDTFGYRVIVGQPDGRFSAAALPTRPSDPSETVVLAVDAQGETFAVWVTSDSSQVWASIRPPGGQFGRASQVSVKQADAYYPALAVNALGDAIVAWRDYDDAKTVVSLRPAGGQFASPTILGDASGHQQVAIDEAGDAVAAWVTTDMQDGYHLVESSAPAGGTFPVDGPTTLDVFEDRVVLPGDTAGYSLDMDPATGSTQVSWLEPIAFNINDQEHVPVALKAETLPLGGVPAGPVTLDHASSAILAAPDVAAGDGQGTVVWGRMDIHKHTETVLTSSG